VPPEEPAAPPEEPVEPTETPIVEEITFEVEPTLEPTLEAAGATGHWQDGTFDPVNDFGLPEDTDGNGYQNECEQPRNDCDKLEGGVQNGVSNYTPPIGTPTVVIIKAGRLDLFFTSDGPACTNTYCVTWNADGSVTVERLCTGPDCPEISNIQFWVTQGTTCPDAGVCPSYECYPGGDQVPDGNCGWITCQPGPITPAEECLNYDCYPGGIRSQMGIVDSQHVNRDQSRLPRNAPAMIVIPEGIMSQMEIVIS